jgi:23S rRNA (cytosine1962-C5)-methyltransferase
MFARVVLEARRARPFYGRHPWVFAGAIHAVEGEPADGDVVDVVSHEGNFIARGLYNSQSKIRTRLYCWDQDVALDRAFFRAQLAAAIRMRDMLWPGGTRPACRLVFSEGDGLSGLVVDRYDRWLVVQFTSLALAQRREMFGELLVELLRPEGIYLRTERDIGRLEGLELHDGPLWGEVPQAPFLIDEGGVRFFVNIALGQKTGFYLDQSANRSRVADLASGRRVLDACCYTGGFGLEAARAGALSVLGIDKSEAALQLAQESANVNNLRQVQFRRGDAFHELDSLAAEGTKFDLVVLDPPKFARRQSAVEEALRGHHRLHTAALDVLAPDGLLVTCCCSGLITADMLKASLARVAAVKRREVHLLEVRGAAADHPVSVACLESEYLKCLIAHVRAPAGARAPEDRTLSAMNF